jgi:hypothetical protein
MKKYYFLSLLVLVLFSQQSRAQLVISLGSQTNDVCNGGATGTATITVVGAIGLCSYTWAPAPGGGQGTATATNLIAGTYTCSVRDSVFGSGSKVVIITQPSAISANPTVSNAVCNGGSTGSVSLLVQGGTAPYSCRHL